MPFRTLPCRPSAGIENTTLKRLCPTLANHNSIWLVFAKPYWARAAQLIRIDLIVARLEAKHCVYKRLLEIRPALLCAYKGEQILTMASDEDILTIAELSEHLRAHPTTIYRLLREGRIP